MDKTALVEKDIQEGKRLIEALDKEDFGVQAAVWLYMSEAEEWRLFVASPFVEVNGPRKAYTFIQTVLSKLSPPSEFSLRVISAVSPKHQVVSLLRTAIRTPVGPELSGIRFTGNVVNNTLIDDAYIYRMQ